MYFGNQLRFCSLFNFFAGNRVLRCNVVAKPKSRNNLVTRLDGQESSSLFLLCSRHKSRFQANATTGQPEAFDPKSKPNSFRDSLDAFYRFSRPHTVIGTVKQRSSFKNQNIYGCNKKITLVLCLIFGFFRCLAFYLYLSQQQRRFLTYLHYFSLASWR